MKKTYFALAIGFLISCNNINKNSSDGKSSENQFDDDKVIDVTGLYTEANQKYVDDYLEAVKIVSLETSEASALHHIKEVVVSESSNIYVIDRYQGGSVALFDNDGKFIKRIPTGQAPSEIAMAGSIFFDKETSFLYVYDSGNERLVKFTSGGDYLSSHQCGFLASGIAVRGDKVLFYQTSTQNKESEFRVIETDTVLNEISRKSFGECERPRQGFDRYFNSNGDGIVLNMPFGSQVNSFLNGKWSSTAIIDRNSTLEDSPDVDINMLRMGLPEGQLLFNGVSYHTASWSIYSFVGNFYSRSLYRNNRTKDVWFKKPFPKSFFNVVDLCGVQEGDGQFFVGTIDPEYMINGSSNPDYVWDGSNMNGLISDSDMDKLKKLKLDDNPLVVLFKLKSDR